MRAETLDLIRTCRVSPLAIMEDRWDALVQAIATGQDTPAAIDAALGVRDRGAMASDTSVVVIPIHGMITPRSRFWGTSCEQLVIQAEAAAANPAVKAIVFDVESPGGFVSGVPEAAARLFNIRGTKPTVAVVNHMMASAAYYLGSAADRVVISPSGLAGSIGVFSAHVDISKALEDFGVKVTIVRAGRYKAEGNPYEPLSDEAHQHMQDTVNSYYGRFIGAVATHRSTTARAVASGYGEGRVLTADAAVAADLADSVATLDEVLVDLGVDPAALNAARSVAIAAAEQREREARERSEERSRKPQPAMSASVHFVLKPVGAGTPVDLEGVLDGRATDQVTADRLQLLPVAAEEDADEVEDPENQDNETDPDEDDQPEATEGAPAVSNEPSNPNAAQPAEENTMPESTAAPGGAAPVDVGADATALERKRIRDVTRHCHDHSAPPQLLDAFIEQGTSAENAEKFLKATATRANGPISHTPQQLLDMSGEERQRFSVVRAINAAASGNWGAAGFEREVHAEISKKLGREPRSEHSVLIPTALGALPKQFRGVAEEVGRPRAALDTGTATGGQELVFTEPGSFIDMLRNRMVTTRLGATFLPGLQGNVDFPRQTGAGTFQWRAENPGSDVTISDLVTGSVELRPRDGTSRTSFSRRLLAQSVVNVEQLVRRDLASIAAIGLDLAGLHGPGGDSPTGLYGATGVNAVPLGGAISWANVVALETAIVAENADIGAMAYATTPEIRGAAKTTEKAANTAQFIWTGGVDGGEMNGFRSLASNQLAKNLGAGTNEHGILFGVWEHLLIGEWGAMEIIVDPFTLAGQGLFVITIFLIADVAPRYPEAFSKGTGLTV